MSVDLQNLNPQQNNSDDYDLENFDFSDDEIIRDTSNLGQNVITSGNNNNANNSNNDANLAGRAAPIGSQVGSILGILSTVITKVVPPLFFVAGGIVALTVPIPVLGMGLGAIIAPICFGAAVYLTITALGSADALEEETEILTQRINILDKLNHIYGEIDKLRGKADESGAMQSQMAAKQRELEETQEILNNFDMHYGIGLPTGNMNVPNVISQGQANPPNQNLPPVNPNPQNVKIPHAMDDDSDEDDDDLDESFEFVDSNTWDESFEESRVEEVEDDDVESNQAQAAQGQARAHIDDSSEESSSDIYGNLDEDSDDL